MVQRPHDENKLKEKNRKTKFRNKNTYKIFKNSKLTLKL